MGKAYTCTHNIKTVADALRELQRKPFSYFQLPVPLHVLMVEHAMETMNVCVQTSGLVQGVLRVSKNMFLSFEDKNIVDKGPKNGKPCILNLLSSYVQYCMSPQTNANDY